MHQISAREPYTRGEVYALAGRLAPPGIYVGGRIIPFSTIVGTPCGIVAKAEIVHRYRRGWSGSKTLYYAGFVMEGGAVDRGRAGAVTGRPLRRCYAPPADPEC